MAPWELALLGPGTHTLAKPCTPQGGPQPWTTVPGTYHVCPGLMGSRDTSALTHTPSRHDPAHTQAGQLLSALGWTLSTSHPCACPGVLLRTVTPLKPPKPVGSSQGCPGPLREDRAVPDAGPLLSRVLSPIQKQHGSQPPGWHVTPIMGPHSTCRDLPAVLTLGETEP